MTRAAVLLAPGFEEIEAITIIDVLRRANIDTQTLAIAELEVRGSHDITVRADALLADRADEDWDAVILPGGLPGSNHLRDSELVQRLISSQHAKKGLLAAICAAPIALSKAGILRDRKATSNPSHKDQIECAEYLEERVVVDGTVVTSRAVGTALPFALRIVSELTDKATADKLGAAMLVAG